jgi:hypothetical protein
MNRDERMGYLLGGLATAWAVGGLLLLALVARWDAGAFSSGLEGILGAFYLTAFGALAISSLFFAIRGYWQSGNPSAIIVFIFELLLIIPLGRAILWLLGGG